MKLCVTGGRDFKAYDVLCRVLDEIRPDSISHGDMPGADYLAHRWAEERHVPVTPFTPNWIREGRAAGPIRNRRMWYVYQPDKVVAFKDGFDLRRSRQAGTEDMVRVALAGGLEVTVYDSAGNHTVIAPRKAASEAVSLPGFD